MAESLYRPPRTPKAYWQKVFDRVYSGMTKDTEWVRQRVAAERADEAVKRLKKTKAERATQCTAEEYKKASKGQ